MPPDPISRSAAKEAMRQLIRECSSHLRAHAAQEVHDEFMCDLDKVLDALPAAEADGRDREPDNPAELIRKIIAHCESESLPDFVSDLNPKDERRIRDSRSWIVTVGELRAFLKAIERAHVAAEADGRWEKLREHICQLGSDNLDNVRTDYFDATEDILAKMAELEGVTWEQHMERMRQSPSPPAAEGAQRPAMIRAVAEALNETLRTRGHDATVGHSNDDNAPELFIYCRYKADVKVMPSEYHGIPIKVEHTGRIKPC